MLLGLPGHLPLGLRGKLTGVDACLKITLDRSSLAVIQLFMGYIIQDAEGYWCGRRRTDGRLIDFWSSRKVDAAKIHFHEVAKKIASQMPQSVRVVTA